VDSGGRTFTPSLQNALTFNQMVERYGILDRTYGALAHPVRRGLLELLRTGPERVTELATQFEVSLAATSKHIQVLESAGLSTRTISGRDHLIALESHPLIEAGRWIDTYRSFWEPRLDALDAHLRRGGSR
jgi:DNA-binding transcriptional ArsR family regulator